MLGRLLVESMAAIWFENYVGRGGGVRDRFIRENKSERFQGLARIVVNYGTFVFESREMINI
jgi:hypothetical protein